MPPKIPERSSSKRKAADSITHDRNKLQKDRVTVTQKGDKTSQVSRALVLLFKTSRRGLAVDTRPVQRPSGRQIRFKKALQRRTESRNDKKEFRCPVTKAWWDARLMRAAHLVPWRTGQEVMTMIFGAKADGELFAATNGIFMYNIAQKLFDEGLLLIVPNLPQSATLAQFRLWHVSEPKEYKIRIPDKTNDKVILPINQLTSEKTWVSLDNTKVEFPGDWRARARYLYYAYIQSILRQSWRPVLQSKDKYANALKEELGRPYWGTIGGYMKSEQIAAMVAEMGPSFNGLMEASHREQSTGSGAAEDKDPIALAAAIEHIAAKVAREIELGADEHTDEEEIEEGEEESEEESEDSEGDSDEGGEEGGEVVEVEVDEEGSEEEAEEDEKGETDDDEDDEWEGFED